MQLGPDDVKKIAYLARLAIDEGDSQKYATNLSNILQFVAQMSAIDTENVEPMAHPQHAVQRLRADVVTESNQRDQLMANAPLAEGGLFLVPRVIE